MSYPVCPACYDGMHSACTGNGCYCDCQLEGTGLEEEVRCMLCGRPFNDGVVCIAQQNARKRPIQLTDINMRVYCPKCRSEVILSHHLANQCDSCALVLRMPPEPVSEILMTMLCRLDGQEHERLWGSPNPPARRVEVLDGGVREIR